MPRNRPDIDRGEKIAAILDASERRLRTGGVAAFSVAELARELGLAANSIYWYFPTRDDLLVATVEHALLGILGRKPPGMKRLDSRILWFVEQLDELEGVRVGLHERARESTTIADFLTRLDDRSRTMLRNVLAGHVPEADLDLAAQTLLATVEGARLQRLDGRTRRRVIEFAVRQVASDDR